MNLLTITLNPCVDHKLFVSRILPHDTNRVKSLEIDIGGKGVSVSRVASRLGAAVMATGFVGGTLGHLIRLTLAREHIDERFVEVLGETRINFCVEEEDGLPPTTFHEPGPTIDAEKMAELMESVSAMATHCSWMLVGGSLPPGVPPSFVVELCETARKAGSKVAVDADGETLRLAMRFHPDFIKPNLHEAERFLGRRLTCEAEIVDATRFLQSQLSAGGYATISLGADGAVMATGDHVWIGASPDIRCVSSVGSGDSMVGAMLWAIEAGMSSSDVLRYGLAAGAATAAQPGPGLCSLQTIDALMPRAHTTAAPSPAPV